MLLPYDPVAFGAERGSGIFTESVAAGVLSLHQEERSRAPASRTLAPQPRRVRLSQTAATMARPSGPPAGSERWCGAR